MSFVNYWGRWRFSFFSDAFFKETNLQKECETLDAQHDETMSRLSKGSAKVWISTN